MKIGEIFKTDIRRDINPVIKVSDQSEEQLRDELDNYVVTEVIERYLEEFLNHYAETRLRETGHIGIWLYGFVGAGKSHFAKIIGLLLANPQIAGQNSIDRFIPRIQTCKRPREMERLLFEVRNNIVTEVIPFHINSEANQAGEDNICRIFYRVFLRHFGFSEDIRIASVEQTLIRAGKYDEFKSIIGAKTGNQWEIVRRPDYWDLYRQDIFTTLAEILPESYSSPEDAQMAFEGKQPLLTLHNFAERVAEYVSELDERDKGKTHRVLFIVDELGAFIADSGKKLHDVGALAEEFARVGKGRLWIFATGHHSVKDIVENAREFEGDRLWLEGRFHLQFQLTAENIEVVLEERLFRKNTKGGSALTQLYINKPGAISEKGQILNSSRALPNFNESSFVSTYPFRPYQTILVHEVVQRLRTAGGRSEVLTGSTRTILGLSQGILKDISDKEIGYLIPFNKFFEQLQDGVEIPHQIRAEINGVDQRLPDQPVSLKPTLQTLFLLQQLEYIPTSPRNMALFLTDHIDADLSSLESRIRDGLEHLKSAAYVVETGGLYRYISGEERDDAEMVEQKKAEVKTVHRREALKNQFLTSHLLPIGVVQYEDRFQFDIRVICDGRFNEQGEYTQAHVIHGRGDLEVRIFSCLSATLNDTSLEDLEVKSLSDPTVVYWLSNKSNRIERLLTELIGIENAMGPIAADTTQSTERRKRGRRYLEELETHIKPQIEEEVKRCLREGHIIFQGSAQSIAAGSDDLNVIFKREISNIIPRIYPQFNRGRYRIENERKTIETIFSAPASKLYSIEPSLGLFDNQGNLKMTTPVIADIYDYLDRAAQQGERETGEMILKKFAGIPYGWDQNLIRVVTASLFRVNLLVLRDENASYRDYKIEAAMRIFRESKKFNRAELTLEAETPPSQGEIKRAREEAELIFGIRPQETPSSIAESLELKINELLDEHRRIIAWVDGAKFPVNDEFRKAPDILKRVIDIRRPNAVVKEFLGDIERVRKVVSGINSLSKFYESPDKRGKFNDMLRLLKIGRFLQERMEREEMPHTFEATDFLERVWKEKTLLERFPEATTHLLQAIPELRRKFEELKNGYIESISKTVERLLSFGKGEGLSEERLAGILRPLVNRQKIAEDAQFDLHGDGLTFEALWIGMSEVEALEDRARHEIEAQARKKEGEKEKPGKLRKRIRLRELSDIPRIIRNNEDLGKTLKGIEKAVKDTLENDQEVELD